MTWKTLLTSGISIHDLTRRSTESSFPEALSIWYFNSRPHKEVDRMWIDFFLTYYISIHDLTRRSTRMPAPASFYQKIFQFTTSQGGRQDASPPYSDFLYISIHDLTRRSTQILYSLCFFISFQFTTSQGGRPYSADAFALIVFISIHDLTRRSTVNDNNFVPS